MVLIVFHVGNEDSSPAVYNTTLPDKYFEPSLFCETTCLPGRTEHFDGLWPLQK